MAYVANQDIYLMHSRTKERHRLTEGRSPDWSPDGESIVFVSNRAGRPNIYKTDINGEEVQQLTNAGGNGSPAWSPDGQWIAYDAEVENPWGNPNRDSNIYLTSPTGAHSRQLTDHPAKDSFPAWVPPAFLSVAPTVEKQTTLWGRLKQPAHD